MTVVALVVLDWKTRSEAIVATINAKPCEEVFMALVIGYSYRRHVVELQTICWDTQFRKGDEVVTFRTLPKAKLWRAGSLPDESG